MSWPTTLTINAWTGDKVASGAVSAQAQDWAKGAQLPNVPVFLKPPEDADARDWSDPDVGWGLILPDRTGLSTDDLASGADAPEPLRRLLKARNDAPVFRYRPGSPHLLHNYAANRDIAVTPQTPNGIGDRRLPKYLLIYGTPREIPWEFQYLLNTARANGRLDLEGEALENYVQALLNNWQGASSQIEHALVWAVDFGAGDISHLMRNAIAAKIYDQWRQDLTLKNDVVFLDGNTTNKADAASLLKALSDKRPALVVTTSHGHTGPLDDLAAMKLKLGLLIDQDFQTLDPAQLLTAWEPDGAIWYAHACCSAGSNKKTIYDGLLDPTNDISKVLQGVAALGSLIAPLPTALLGAKKPLRAFIGHVEPTFDWTLRLPENKQYLTNGIVHALYNNIYRCQPVGMAFEDFYTPLGTLSLEYTQAAEDAKSGQDTSETMLYCQLTARDLESMVILGDPTAVLPALP